MWIHKFNMIYNCPEDPQFGDQVGDRCSRLTGWSRGSVRPLWTESLLFGRISSRVSVDRWDQEYDSTSSFLSQHSSHLSAFGLSSSSLSYALFQRTPHLSASSPPQSGWIKRDTGTSDCNVRLDYVMCEGCPTAGTYCTSFASINTTAYQSPTLRSRTVFTFSPLRGR